MFLLAENILGEREGAKPSRILCEREGAKPSRILCEREGAKPSRMWWQQTAPCRLTKNGTDRIPTQYRHDTDVQNHSQISTLKTS